ncbi:MAG: N-acetylmuramoyl-L-alanine amidase [Gammaproteobacteria bacterium]|nr:N-acetylmuramoyl-L-alanine amidase [Gammaproteobacteria bacterium]
MNIIKRHLPSHLYSKHKLKPVGSVIHYISNKYAKPLDPFNLEDIIQIFHTYKVSAHYLIDRDGTIYELVPPTQQAWHAGKSIMYGQENCNAFTFGVELVSTGREHNGEKAFTDEQIEACIELHLQLIKDYDINSRHIHGHDTVRKNWQRRYPEQKAKNKHDPGAQYPWPYFRLELDTRANRI